MTRELVETWCDDGADEIAGDLDAAAPVARRHPARPRRARRARCNAIADGIYARWARSGCGLTDGRDPSAAGPADQPDRRGRGRRAPGGGAEGAARERARRRRDADRRRPRAAAASSASASPTTARASSARTWRSRSRGTRRRRSSTVIDLEAIATLGFRGEALASIAAVSRARARVARAGQAARVAHRGRRRHRRRRSRPPRSPAGTTVTVEELYFNTPARRKFLRTEATEWAHCDEAFRRIALAHPDVGIHAAAQRPRRCTGCTAGGRRARVEALLGDAFVLHAAPVDAEAAGVRLDGLRRAARVRGARPDDAVRVRQRPLRARPRAVACAARGVSRRAASRPPAGVRAVADARSAARRRQRASAEDRGALSRFRRDAPVRAPRGRARAGGDRGRAARGVGRRAARHRGGAAAAARRARAMARSRDRRGSARSRASLPARTPGAACARARRRASRRRSTRGCSASASADAPALPERRRPSARLRARAAARHLHARAEPRRAGARRHARGARAHRLRAAEGARSTAACRCSRCSCPRRSPPSRSRWPRPRARATRSTRSASRSRALGPGDARRARHSRAARRCRRRRRSRAPCCTTSASSAARSALDGAPRRAAVDDGLPRRGAREPQPDDARDERAAARDGSDRARRASAITAGRRGTS